MRGRDLRRVERDLAARRPGSVAEAAARAHRGAALARAALRGEPLPETAATAPAPPHPPRPPRRVELVACSECYSPHEGLPNTRCPTCAAAVVAPVDLSEVLAAPDPP